MLDKLSPKEKRAIRLQRNKALITLTAKGIKNANKILQILEAESTDNFLLRYIDLEMLDRTDYSGETARQRVHETYDRIYKDALSREFIDRCKEIGDVSLAHERMHQLGGNLNLEGLMSSHSEEMIQMAKQLTRLSEDDFRDRLQSLKEYQFLFPTRNYSPEDNLQYEAILDFINSNNTLTREQREALNIANRIYKITYGSKNGYSHHEHPLLRQHDPQLLLSNKHRLADELLILEQLALELYDPSRKLNLETNWRQKNLSTGFVSLQLDILAESGDLFTLASLIREGFSIGTNHALIMTDRNWGAGGKLELLQNGIRKSHDLLELIKQNPQLESQLAFAEDLKAAIHPNEENFTISNISSYETQSKPETGSKETIQNIVRLVLKLSDDPAERRRLLYNFLDFDEDIGPTINPANLFETINREETLAKLPQEEQDFFKTLIEWRRKGISNNFISSFLVSRLDRFSEYYENGRLSDQFLYDFSDFFATIPETYFKRKYLDRDINISQINMFLLDSTTAPPSLASLADIFSLLDQYDRDDIINTFDADYSNWSRFITDGKPNITLVNYVLEKTENTTAAFKILSPELIEALPEEEQQFWITWKKINTNSANLAQFLYQNRNKFSDYFIEESLTPVLLEDFYRERIEAKSPLEPADLTNLIYSGLLDRFPKRDLALWKTLDSAGTYASKQFALEHLEYIKNLFTDEGEATSDLMLYLAQGGAIDLQEALLREETVASFLPVENDFWHAWMTLPYDGKIVFNNKLKDNQISIELVNEVAVYTRLFEEIENSPSLELQKIKNQLIALLLESPKPEDSLRQIQALFERNNLPDFGKRFRIFEILYLTPERDGKTKFDMEMENKGEGLSPVLKNSSHRRQVDTIYRDLLKVNIESGDPSLRLYLNAMYEGQEILDRAESEGYTSLDDREMRQLSRFLNRATVLYENSLLGRLSGQSQTETTGDIEQSIQSLRVDLRVRDGQKISERIAEMYIKPLGYDSVESALDRMDQAKFEAHQRNLTNPNVREGQLVINAGDLIKGVGYDVLSYILQGGSVAREYIGVDAGSDLTPFDIDTNMILSEELEKGTYQAINASLASGYGDMMLLIRDRGQFYRSDQQETVDLQYQTDRYELFHSEALADTRHFGIRTGIPSTEIDGIILKPDLLAEDELAQIKREGIYFRIANNGFFIPVVDNECNVLFNEADYNTYRLNRSAIESLLNDPKLQPKQLIEILKSSPYLKRLYEMDSGVGEGYTTEEHTEMVMGQFEKYFADQFYSSLITREEFRLMLALHDIGKPVAMRTEGSTQAQHKYTKLELTFALQAAGIPTARADIIVSFVDQDIVGEFIQGHVDAGESARKIHELSEALAISPNELLETLRMFYICDAGAYTTDAGGTPSLDNQFEFRNVDGRLQAYLSPENEIRYQELVRFISPLS